MGNQDLDRRNTLPRAGIRKRMLANWYDTIMAKYEAYMAERKRALFADLPNTVMEIGPGTGANLRYLPRGCHWIGIEPNPFMRDQLQEKAEKAGVKAEFQVARAERIELDDHSVDAAICTLVLCSVADPPQVLAEVKRVLKPGGRFYFIEHVAAPRNTWRRLSQRVVRPVWRFCADGCRPDRDTGAAINEVGFESVEIEEFEASFQVMPRFVAPHIIGVAGN